MEAQILAAHPYAPILVLILTIIAFAAVTLALSHLIGPKRRGPIKDDTYEAGMPTIGDARRRFRVGFYLVAMMFLLFDVEIVLLWPWLLMFYDASVRQDTAAMPAAHGTAHLFAAIAFFFVILVIGYVYDLGKGVFRSII